MTRAGWGLLLALASPLGWALPPRAELLPGADPSDWLLIIEADGERQSNELEISPLLRQFAVGKVTMSRVTTPVQQLTRWQIPLHQSDSPANTKVVIAPLKLGNEFTPSLTLPLREVKTAALPQPAATSPLEMQASLDHQGPLYPGQPVIYRLTLSQRLEPATTGEVGEPLIRILTLTMENGDSGQIQLAPLMAHQLPSGIQAHPDGEQQQERYRDGKLLFEQQWRQTLVADQSGDYQLPPIDLPWFNTQSGRIEQASLPAITLTFQATTNRQPDQQTSQVALRESLWWVVLAITLRALWRHWPRWRAFYQLQRARRTRARLFCTALFWPAHRVARSGSYPQG